MMSLIFVSQALIDPGDRTRELDDILAVAMARNSMMDITGLLIASPGHFAQLLEGPVAGVEAVMASTRADARHTQLRTVTSGPIEAASCARWQMVRFIEADFGISILDPLLQAAHTGEDPEAVQRLQRLIEAIALDPESNERSYLDPTWVPQRRPNVNFGLA